MAWTWIMLLVTASGPAPLPFKYGSEIECEAAGVSLRHSVEGQDPLRPGPKVKFICFKGPA